jgi:hypothetical protein
LVEQSDRLLEGDVVAPTIARPGLAAMISAQQFAGLAVAVLVALAAAAHCVKIFFVARSAVHVAEVYQPVMLEAV